MRFLLDENFPKAARSLLEGLSHDVIDFRSIGREGAPDTEVFEAALRECAVILTTDRDFFHTLGRQDQEHFGIVVIALKKPTRSAILERLAWFLGRVPPEKVHRRAFQLRDQSWQVYPAID